MVQGPYHEGMATVTYNRRKRIFTVIWKDYKKEALGAKYPYGRKSRKWQGEKAPSSAERKQIEKELLDLASKAEYQSKEQAQYIRVYGNDEEITASGYLTTLSDDDLTITRRQGEKKEARRFINDFVTWLDIKHKGIALHKINEAITREYYKHLQAQGITFATIQKYITRLSYIFKQVIRKYEDSPLKYKNPFSTLRLDEVITKTAATKRKPYNETQLQDFLYHSMTSEKLNKWQILQRFSIFYFLTVTGWRISDILGLTWKQVDLQKGIINLTHSKTKNQGIKTELFITDLMIELLTTLQLLKEQATNENQDFIFSLRNENVTSLYNNISKFYKKIRMKLQLDENEQKGKLKTYTYTIHSFRHTVITRLTQAGYQEAKINYLVGHAPRTTEEKHYISLSADDTRGLIEHMEDLAKARYFFEKLEIARDLYKSEIYLDLIAKKAKANQENNIDNERFIPLP